MNCRRTESVKVKNGVGSGAFCAALCSGWSCSASQASDKTKEYETPQCLSFVPLV